MKTATAVVKPDARRRRSRNVRTTPRTIAPSDRHRQDAAHEKQIGDQEQEARSDEKNSPGSACLESMRLLFTLP